ncbi:transcriptional regulator NrdR [Opitutales bacterium ASA1]|uniref:transcriptional regulator NrdR n=1 Tax=Congregicoccus parvus TaxID=3081749 RepID=UPI002B2C1D29|nr:transcriptional regulator NrdR [Opitutales bacterium ASA1]
MRCPRCTSTEDRVIDSRASKDGATIRRRRECISCGHRYSTTETIVREGLVVIKRDGRREEFDRAKILGGLRKACEKRPIDVEQLDILIEDVIDALEARFDCEVPSLAIGEEVMARIRRIDPIAYVRFASVYKDFRDINELMADVSSLDHPDRP